MVYRLTCLMFLTCIFFASCEKAKEIKVLDVDSGVAQKDTETDRKMSSLPEGTNVIMGVVFPTSNKQWFIKMAGPASEFTKVTPMFDKFEKTLVFDDYSVEEIMFELAEGWVQTKEKGFIHSSITHPDLKTKITVSTAKGTLLENVNRWNRQLGLGPLSEFQLLQVTKKVNFNGYFGILAVVVNNGQNNEANLGNSTHPPVKRPEPETPEVSGSKGIRVAFGLADNQTWYIKMTGSSNTLILQKKNFESFVSSFKFGGDKPSWTVPEGWSAGVQGSMSIGTFTVADSTVTVTPLGAQSGSLDSNVNRWRRQISLPAQSLEEIQKSLQKISVDGNEFNYLFISSTSGEVDVPENHPKIDNGGEK